MPIRAGFYPRFFDTALRQKIIVRQNLATLGHHPIKKQHQRAPKIKKKMPTRKKNLHKPRQYAIFLLVSDSSIYCPFVGHFYSFFDFLK
jgi:hypothetical protein